MDDGSRWYWLIVLLLLFGAIYCSVTEMAFTSVSKTRLKTLAERGDRAGKKALAVTESMDRALTTILILTNIFHLAAAALVTLLVTRRFGASFVALSTIVTTLVVFFFGEMLPKSIARKYNEHISLATAGSLSFLMVLLRPLSAILTACGNAVASLTKGEEASITEDELLDIIEDMTEEGTLNEAQGELISQALQFGDTTVESILTARVDVKALDVASKPDEVIAYIKEHNHSRLPVYEETIDHVIGILQIRRYIRAYLQGKEDLNLKDDLDPPIFVHQSTKIDDLLRMMSEEKMNMAVVTDHYGGTLGIVTVEDILEELVGEIWDEDDRIVRNIVPIGESAYSVNAEEHVLDVFDETGIDYDDDDDEEWSNRIMSDFAFEHFEAIPAEGDSFIYHNGRFTILSMKRSRIFRIKVERLPEEVDDAPDNENTAPKEVSS